MSDDDAFAAQLRDLFARSEERNAQADELYQALTAAKWLPKQRALAYYCRNRRRCLLLDVVPTPTGLLLHLPRYKLSPAANVEASSEDGRRANTEDGDRHWRGHSFYVEQAADSLLLTCDHVRATIPVAVVLEDLDAGRREVRYPR